MATKSRASPAAKKAVSRSVPAGSNATGNSSCLATSILMCISSSQVIFSRGRTARISIACRPYKGEVGWIKSHLADTFARYLRCGITSVVDVGGPMWNFEVRKTADSTAKAPRVAVAGPLISSVSREKLDLGDPPIVKIDTPDQAREFVRK